MVSAFHGEIVQFDCGNRLDGFPKAKIGFHVPMIVLASW